MKSISANLAQHLAGEVLSVAHCIKVVRTDSTVLGFTDHDRDIVYDGVTYEASTAYNISALASSSDLSVDKIDIEAVLDSSYITAADLRAGKYDFAKWYIFLINWKDTTMGVLNLSNGWFGKTEIGKHKYFTEANTMFQALDQSVGELVGPQCRANLGDSRCGVTLATYTVSGSVTSVTSTQIFTDTSITQASIYNQGMLTWVTGSNAGYSIEVKSNTAAGVFTLTAPMPYIITIGDTYTVYRGCDKLLATCISTFNNVDNFRGEPWLPGIDKMYKYGKR